MAAVTARQLEREAHHLKERFGAPRIAAAGLMAVGIGLMLHAS
ncbi:hypothetical protein ACX6XY_20720 [Streptomyces sp. O3]